MYYRETSICISWIILRYCHILIFYISVILYLFAGGYKCRLTSFPTRFALVISILRYCHCFASLKVMCHEQMIKYHIISYCTYHDLWLSDPWETKAAITIWLDQSLIQQLSLPCKQWYKYVLYHSLLLNLHCFVAGTSWSDKISLIVLHRPVHTTMVHGPWSHSVSTTHEHSSVPSTGAHKSQNSYITKYLPSRDGH